MTDDEKLELAANVLHYGAALAPGRFPRPSELVLVTWGEALGTYHFPPGVWPEAVRLWATEVAGDRMATTGELVRAARTVVSRWESRPGKRDVLREFRAARVRERERRWREIGPPPQSASVEGGPRVSEEVIDRARRAVGLPPLAGGM